MGILSNVSKLGSTASVMLAVCKFLIGPADAQNLAEVLTLQPQLKYEEKQMNTKFSLPVGPWQGNALPVEVMSGVRRDRVWSYGATSVTLTQFSGALVADWQDEGYIQVLNCFDRVCGGFDFQKTLDGLVFPKRPVAVFDFLAQSWVKAAAARFVLITKTLDEISLYRVDIAPETMETGTSPTNPVISLPTDGIEGLAMPGSGSWVIDGVIFASGENKVQVADTKVILALVSYLQNNKAARIVLVGHSDNQGSLRANLAISKQRAAQLRDVLVLEYGVSPSRIDVEGVAYLAPRSSNSTAEGQAANRRVEAVFLNP